MNEDGLDPRVDALLRRQNREEQELSRQWFAAHPHLYDPVEMQEWKTAEDAKREVITYADRKAENDFFAPHRERWLREGRELQALIDAETSSAS